MAQLQKGFEYDSSNPVKNIVTDDNLNALVANATLLSGAITEQTANSITADSDVMVLSKAGGLIKQTKGQFTNTINSNIVNVNTVNAALVDTDSVDTVAASVTGNLSVGGNSAMTGNLAVSGALTSSGTANFTGALQVNGAVGYVLTEVVEQTVAPFTVTSVAQTYVAVFTSASYTKPSDEIWRIEIVGALQYNTQNHVGYKIKRTSSAVDLIGSFDVDHGIAAYDRMAPLNLSAIENTGTSFTSTYTFEMAYGLSGYVLGVGQTTNVNVSLTATIPATKFRIYKYKTA